MGLNANISWYAPQGQIERKTILISMARKIDTRTQEAPLLVRASLVGASTAMMTPLFPVIGLNYLVFRHSATKMLQNTRQRSMSNMS